MFHLDFCFKLLSLDSLLGGKVGTEMADWGEAEAKDTVPEGYLASWGQSPIYLPAFECWFQIVLVTCKLLVMMVADAREIL